MKKVLCLLLAVMMCVTFVACQPTDETSTTTTTVESETTTTTVDDGDTTTTVEGDDVTTTVEGDDVTTTVGNDTDTTTANNKVTTTKNKVTTTAPKATTTTKSTGKEMTRDEMIAKIPANVKNTKVVYFYWHNPHDRMEGPALAEFKKKTGIELVYEESSANAFYDELTARVTAGNSPDMVRNRFTSIYALAGLQPVSASGYDFSADASWDPYIMGLYTLNGNCYGINTKNSAILDVNVMYYNRRALKATSGLQDPYELWKKGEWTWDKFFEMCEKFIASKRGAEGYYGASFEYGIQTYALTRTKEIVYYDQASKKYVNNMKSSDLVKAYNVILEQFDKGNIVSGDRLTEFDEGKILFFSSGPFSCRTKDPRAQVLKKKKNLGTVPMPTDNTTKYTLLYEATSFGIPIGAKNAAAVPYLVRYITDQASYDMKDVYCDEQALTSVNEMISRGNYNISHVAGYITGKADNPVNVEFKYGNLQTELDAKYPAVNAAIEEANNRLLTLGKQ